MFKFLRKFSFFSLFESGDIPVLRVLRQSHSGEVEESLIYREEQTVLEVALENRIRIATSCGGMGTCGTCRVELLEAPADFEGPNEIECEMAKERGFSPGERLACQLGVRSGMKVRIPETSVED